VVINFNKKLYSVFALQQAIKAYHGLGKFSLKVGKKYIKVSMAPTDKNNMDLFGHEFSNYVLASTRMVR